MSIYRLTDEAIQDLDDIVTYLSSFSLNAGNRFLDAFEQKCETLARLPRIGKIYYNLQPDLRGLTIDNHIIFYRIVEDNIEVIRVVSGRRDLEKIFSEGDENK